MSREDRDGRAQVRRPEAEIRRSAGSIRRTPPRCASESLVLENTTYSARQESPKTWHRKEEISGSFLRKVVRMKKRVRETLYNTREGDSNAKAVVSRKC